MFSKDQSQWIHSIKNTNKQKLHVYVTKTTKTSYSQVFLKHKRQRNTDILLWEPLCGTTVVDNVIIKHQFCSAYCFVSGSYEYEYHHHHYLFREN